MALAFVLPWVAMLLASSILLNLWQFHAIRRKRRSPAPTLDAQDLLHDLTARGAAILKVEVINPANLMLRSPRG